MLTRYQFIPRTTTYLTKPFPHSERILKTIHKTPLSSFLPIPPSYYLPPSPPILISKPSVDITQNYHLLKYIPIFEKQNLMVPFPITCFPTKGISGSYTLSPTYREFLLVNDVAFTSKIAYNFNYYCNIMYGGNPIKSVDDILIRIKQLFKATPLKNIEFPLLQNFLSMDTLYLSIPHQGLTLPDNFIITPSVKMTPQKYIEAISLNATHGQFEDYSIIFGEKSDSFFKKIVEDNTVSIQSIIKQPCPDALFIPKNTHSPLIIGHKGACVLDVKICHPVETALPMLSSFSSITPQHQVLANAAKMEGQLFTQANKIFNEDQKNIYRGFHQELQKMITRFKKTLVKNPNSDTNTLKLEYESWLNNFLIKQLQSSDLLATGMCFLPSKIAEILLPDENAFEILQKNNPQLLQQMFDDIKNSKNMLILLFPQMKDYPRYDPYKVQYEIMTILQKYQMIENYYAVRKLLSIEDIIYPQ